MGGFVVPGKMSGPPVPPPGTPTITGYGAGKAPQPAESKGIMMVIHAVEKTLDVIARSVPDVSKEIDQMKQILTSIINKAALSPTPEQGMEPTSEEKAPAPGGQAPGQPPKPAPVAAP